MGKETIMVHHIPITQARIHLGELVRRAHLNKECFILEKDKIPVAGIIDVGELEDYLELQDPELKKQIQESYACYQKGEFKAADTFLAELKEELTESPKRKTKVQNP